MHAACPALQFTQTHIPHLHLQKHHFSLWRSNMGISGVWEYWVGFRATGRNGMISKQINLRKNFSQHLMTCLTSLIARQWADAEYLTGRLKDDISQLKGPLLSFTHLSHSCSYWKLFNNLVERWSDELCSRRKVKLSLQCTLTAADTFHTLCGEAPEHPSPQLKTFPVDLFH